MGANKTSRGGGPAASPCASVRDAYHDCFNKWYSEKFSKGQWDKEECVAEWDNNIWKTNTCGKYSWKQKHPHILLKMIEALRWMQTVRSTSELIVNRLFWR